MTTELKIGQILDTGPFVCNGQFGSHLWENKSGRNITLRFMRLWIGVGCRQVADVMVLPYRASDGMTLGPYAQDHYGEPSTPHEQMTQYPEPGIWLAHDDGVYFEWFGNYQAQIFNPAQAIIASEFDRWNVAKAQVLQAYQLLLHRTPEPDEMAPWISALLAYNITPATLCNAITASEEYKWTVKAHAQAWIGYTVPV